MDELEEQLDNILTTQYNLVTTNDLKATLSRFIHQKELEARINELQTIRLEGTVSGQLRAFKERIAQLNKERENQ